MAVRAQDHLALVRKLANRISKTWAYGPNHADVYQAGCVGLLEAVRRYDPSRGVSFRAYAAMRVRGAMLDEMRRCDYVPRDVRRLAKHTGATLPSGYVALEDMDCQPVWPGRSAEACVARRQRAQAARKALGSLPPRAQQIVHDHVVGEHALIAIGRRHGVSESRVCQIVKASIKGMHQHLVANGWGQETVACID